MPLLPCQRALFDIPAGTAYFDCAKMSPLLQASHAAGVAALGRKSHPWDIGARHYFDEADRTRQLFARLIGAEADDIAIIPSVSYGMATALQNVPVAAGQIILMVAEDFPATVYACRALAIKNEARLAVVDRPGELDWTEALLAAIDGNTAVVCVPQVHWVCGTMFDLEAIGRRCRSVGASLVLDTTQSTGALPLNLAAVDPDYLVVTSYKWLLGPYSLGFLYVAPRHHLGRPLEEGWITRKGSEDFRSLIIYEDAQDRTARRFDMGERANFFLLPVAASAIEQLLSWGVANVAETLGAANTRLALQLDLLGLSAADGRAPHYLSVRSDRGFSDDLGEQLARQGVHVSLRGDRMRITGHLYNDHPEEELLLRQLALHGPF